MKKLTEKQIENLKEMKNSGIKFCFLCIRKYFSTWYVKEFSVENLLNSKMLPSYWYKESGISETKALKSGAVRLLNF